MMITVDEAVKCKKELEAELLAAVEKFHTITGLLPCMITIEDQGAEMDVSYRRESELVKISRLVCKIDLRI